MSQENLGSNFDDFLNEEGILEETEAIALKRILAFQLEEYRDAHQLTKQELAKRIHTSRSALDRLLDPKNISITLQTMIRVAKVIGKQVRISIV
ncbi:XRE family transcriptional regulator [Deltaproteobacteria bacterium TL4]